MFLKSLSEKKKLEKCPFCLLAKWKLWEIVATVALEWTIGIINYYTEVPVDVITTKVLVTFKMKSTYQS